MPREVSGSLRLSIDLAERNTGLGDGSRTAQMPHGALFEAIISTGLNDGNLDRIYSDAISVSTSGTQIDLAGSLTSEIGGGTTTFVDLCLIYARNTSSVGDARLGGDTASVPFLSVATTYLVIPPGGVFFWYAPAGITVTATTADILKFSASAGTVNVTYLFAGRSA